MVSRTVRNPLSLVILGLLAEQPLHVYAMRARMRDRGHDRLVRHGAASVYDTSNRLLKAGLIEVHDTNRAGRRPERTVYRITRDGLGALEGWVHDALADPTKPEELPAALSFMFVVPKAQVLAHVEQRRAALEQVMVESDAAVTAAQEGGVAAIFLSEETYSQALRKAEVDWLAQFIAQVRDGTLAWPKPRRVKAAPVQS